jgi:hypothetical protein
MSKNHLTAQIEKYFLNFFFENKKYVEVFIGLSVFLEKLKDLAYIYILYMIFK